MAKYRYSDGARGILHHLQETHRDDMTYRDLAEVIEKTPRSASALITALARKGLVERVVKAEGDDVKYIVLTKAGASCDPDETVEDTEGKVE